MSNVRVAILGAGSLGTALGVVLTGGVPGIRAGKSRDVVLWTTDPEVVREVRERRTNAVHLPGATLPRALGATSDLSAALAGADVILIALPTEAVRAIASQAGSILAEPQPPQPADGTPPVASPVVVSASRGMDPDSFLRMSQVIASELPEALRPRVLALSGPLLALELARGIPAAAVLAGQDIGLARALRRLLQTPILRIQVSRDIAGVELGGILKNPYTLALGLCDGLGLGLNTKAAILARALPEMARLGTALGGRRATFFGLAGLGDLLGTGLSDHGRNRRTGEDLALKREPQESPGADAAVAEGLDAVSTARRLAERRGLRLPLLEGIGAVVDGRVDPLKMLLRLVG